LLALLLLLLLVVGSVVTVVMVGGLPTVLGRVAPAAGSPTATTTLIATATPLATTTVTATATAAATATQAPRPTATTPPPAPRLTILAPANNAIVTTTDGTDPASPPLTFQASASPSGLTVTWMDSVDGLLGTGATLTHTLSSQHNTNCGGHTTHVVSAKATNASGTATASITINVVPFCHS
jgi:hypothetical protein